MILEPVTSLSQSIQPLVDEFNRNKGSPRLIVLVSPT
jgi:hypothetical protein